MKTESSTKNIHLKRWEKKLRGMGAALVLAVSFCTAFVSVPQTVQAAVSEASNLDELAEIVRKEGMERNGDFTVTFHGSDSEWAELFGERIDFFYYTMITKDDPSTSDDADYLVGNIDFSRDIMEAEVESGKIHFTLTYFESLKETAFVNRTTQEILKELGVEGKSNYEKTKLIHDYVCRLITYVDDTEHASSVYSAYTKGEGLCNSYALCMYKLLTEAGVPCKWIGGTAGTGRDADGHAWNLVQLGGRWYHLDATWDDQEDGIVYDYFLKGSSDLDEANPKQLHKMDAEYYYTDYLKKYPVAQTAFQKGMNDENNPVNTDADKESTREVRYQFAQLVTGQYPDSGKISIRKGKMEDIQLYVTKEAVGLIERVSYQVTKGKNLVKVKNMGLYKDRGVYFEDLEVRGIKKGTAKIRVTVTLVNGQSKNYNFTFKIK